MHKGLDWATIVIEHNVQNAKNQIGPQYYELVNEIKDFLGCHYVSPVNAIWRIFEFDIVYCYPSVKLLQFHLSG